MTNEQTAETNNAGCPLRVQPGAAAIKNFAHVIAQLPPELRAAFEREREARQRELDAYIHQQGYRT